MQRKSFVAIPALLALAFVSIVHAQAGATRLVQLYNRTEVGPNKLDWNAICQVENDDHTLWVVGDSGKVRKYTVTYDNWNRPILNFNPATDERNLGSNYKLCDVSFPSQATAGRYGYIVGYRDDLTPEKWEGRIWKTIDYGASWIPMDPNMPTPFGQANIPCLSVDFFNDQKGYVGCGCGYVIRTIDGGTNWQLVEKQPWEGVGTKIGAIPRGYYEGYYNHYGD